MHTYIATKSFVERLFKAIQAKEYVGACTDAHKCAANPIPVISSPVQPATSSSQIETPTKSELSSSIVPRALDTKPLIDAIPEPSSRSREEQNFSLETKPVTVVLKSTVSSVVEVPRSETRSPLPHVQSQSNSDRKIRLKSSIAPANSSTQSIPLTTSNFSAERVPHSSIQRLNERSRSRSPLVPLAPRRSRSRSKSPQQPAPTSGSGSGSGIRSRLGPIPTVVSKPSQSQSQSNRQFDQKRLAKRHSRSRSRSRSNSPKRRDVGPATRPMRTGTAAAAVTSSSSPILAASASSTSHTSTQSVSSVAGTISNSSSTTPIIPTQISSPKSSEGTPLIDTPSASSGASAHSASPRRQRCRDYEERGFCLAGEFCPFDHGNDGIN